MCVDAPVQVRVPCVDVPVEEAVEVSVYRLSSFFGGSRFYILRQCLPLSLEPPDSFIVNRGQQVPGIHLFLPHPYPQTPSAVITGMRLHT